MSGVREIPLTQGKVALVDEADFERLSAFKWCCAKGYPRRRGGQMARYVIDVPPGMVPDHINGDPLDNRRCNLRACTPAENVRNRRTRGSLSGFKCVVYVAAIQRYRAQLHLDRQVYYSACFSTAIAAALAYDAMARELHGEFAAVNFPQFDIPWEWRPGSQPRRQPRMRTMAQAA
jgi:hypothetical protein